LSAAFRSRVGHVRFPSALAQQSGATQLESLKGNLDI